MEEDIDNRLKEKDITNLKFYDGETHKMMFSLPKNIRELIEKEDRIAYDNAPLFAVEE